MSREITREQWAEIRRLQGRATDADPAKTEPLLRYQREMEWSCETNSVTVVEKSRRTGATFGAAAAAVLRSSAGRGRGGMDTLYMGTSHDMAKEFIDACALWARTLNKVAIERGDTLFDDGSEGGIKAMRIDFGDFSIVALSSKPRSLRGRQGFAVLDEAAFVDDLKALLQAALAFLIWGGKVLIISTHNGAGNAFAELVNNIRAGRLPYGLVRFDLDEALRDGLYERICLVSKREWSAEAEAAWRDDLIARYGDGADEELYCVPSAGGGVVLPRALVESRARQDVPVLRLSKPATFKHVAPEYREAEVTAWCQDTLAGPLADLDRGESHALGEDFGRVSDLTVLWPLAISRNLRRRTPFVVELGNIPFEQQRQILFYILDRLPRLQGVKLDGTGNGAYLAEVCLQRYGEHLVEEVKLSTGWYLAEVAPFKAAFEDDMITVPADADIVRDLTTPVYKNGIPSIPTLRRTAEDGTKRHCDAFVAGVMAYAASRADPVRFAYTPAYGREAEELLAEGFELGDRGGRALL